MAYKNSAILRAKAATAFSAS